MGINTINPIANLHVSGNTFINDGLTASTLSAVTITNSGTITTGSFSATTITATTITSPTISATTATFRGTYGSLFTNQSAAMIVFSGSNTIGGTGYTDFIRVTNTAAGAVTPTKSFRLNNSGEIEIINSAYN